MPTPLTPEIVHAINEGAGIVLQEIIDQYQLQEPDPVLQVVMQALQVVIDSDPNNLFLHDKEAVAAKTKVVLSKPAYQSKLKAAIAASGVASRHYTRAPLNEETWFTRPLEKVYGLICFEIGGVDLPGLNDWGEFVYAYAIDAQGYRTVLGPWWSMEEHLFDVYPKIFADLKARGVEHIALVVGADDKEFVAALEAAFPAAQQQNQLLYAIYYSLRMAETKDRRAIKSTIKRFYRAATIEEARAAFDKFAASPVGKANRLVVEQWQSAWPGVERFYQWPQTLKDFLLNLKGFDETRDCIDEIGSCFDDKEMAEVFRTKLPAFASKWSRTAPGWAEARRVLEDLGDERLRAEPPVLPNSSNR